MRRCHIDKKKEENTEPTRRKITNRQKEGRKHQGTT